MAAGQQPISPLVLDEYFAAGDDRFLPALREFHEPKKLAAIADRWKKDHRPWARQQILNYLDLPLDARGHEVVVKHLYKWAEEQNDDELVGAFAVAFDRLVRRVRKNTYEYDWRTRTSWEEERLASPRNVMPHVRQARGAVNPKTGESISVPVRAPRNAMLFSYHTRYYLRRRAWRYFRRKGFRAPADYCAAVAPMLRRYTDGDVAKGENLLDCWSLVHACFGESDLLDVGVSKINVRDGRALGELGAAPEFEKLWASADATRLLVALLTGANCRTVRVWTIQILRRHHVEQFSQFKPDELLPLLDHDDEEVQAFGAEMLERSASLGNLDLPTWLRLLQTRNMAALEIITRLMFQNVRPERLTLEQMVDIASAQPVAVARVGLRFLQGRPIQTAAERATLAKLGNAKSAGVAAEITRWALSVVGTGETYDVNHVTPFFDSLLKEAREAAWGWLTGTGATESSSVGATPASRSPRSGESDLRLRRNRDAGVAPTGNAASPGWNDPALWSRLIETPYDDVRFHVVAELERRVKLPGASPDQISIVWQTVLLNIHRGGRAKLAALRQISRAIQDDPAQAEPLLPVLAVAIRSVRLPEVRTGLSALVAAVAAHPPLAELISRHLPELQLLGEEVVA